MFRLPFWVCALFLLYFPGGAALATDMDEFRDHVSGKTVHMMHKKKGFEVTRYFAPDGTLIQQKDGKYRRGNWSIEDESLCLGFPDTPVKCRKVMGDDPDEYALANRKGSKAVMMFEEYEDGNTIPAPAGQDVAATPAGAIREELISLDTRDGVKQTFLLIEPADRKPVAVIMLYPGHDGLLKVRKVGTRYAVTSYNGGLTAHHKTHQVLAGAGVAVALVAPPSDQPLGMDTDFRESAAHAEDARRIIRFLNDRYRQKVYVHGHCRSSFSPAAIATRLDNEGIAGLIMSSTRSQGRHGSVLELEQGVIKVPILLVHHVDDPCDGTPYRNIPKVKQFYETSSPRVTLISVKGGNPDRPAITECGGGYHTFNGLQKKVVKAIVAWLQQQPVPEMIGEE
jgi:hypothetical protein